MMKVRVFKITWLMFPVNSFHKLLRKMYSSKIDKT